MERYKKILSKKPSDLKVYLINPPSPGKIKMIREGRCMQRSGTWTTIWPPYSLCMIAAILENKGIKIKLSDCVVEGIDFEKLKIKVKEFGPDAVIINTSTPCIDNDLRVARAVREVNDDILTIAIGIHVTELPEPSFTTEPKLDLIIRNEVEETIDEIFSLKTGIDKINGISYREHGKVHNNANRGFIGNLDKLPFPAWHYINFKYYTLPFYDRPFLLLATARGCPYRCTFCSAKPYYGGKLRFRSPKKVVDEMEYAVNNHKINEFLMWTEGFTINNEYAISICKEILDRKLKVNWVCNSRVDTVTENLLDYMKKAGCWMIGYGVESGSQEILDHAKKGIKLQDIKNAITMTKKKGIEVTAHCIIGLIGETKKTVKQTVDLVKKLDVDFAQFYCVVPMPWTELYAEAKNKGYIVTEDWSLYEQNFSVMKTGHLSPEEVVRLRDKAYKSFYLQPKIIFRTLKRIRNYNQLKKFTIMVKDFLTWV
jgi:anaerobic magnesium-protoporphyrin IX monomethyl ester cyclase